MGIIIARDEWGRWFRAKPENMGMGGNDLCVCAALEPSSLHRLFAALPTRSRDRIAGNFRATPDDLHILDVERLQTLDQVRAFLAGNEPVDFKPRSREEAYAFVQRMLVRFDYVRLGEADKGVAKLFLAKTTGLSRAQLTRLLHQFLDTGRIVDHLGGPPSRPFERRYTPPDIRLLATAGRARGSGRPAAVAPARRRKERVLFAILEKTSTARRWLPSCRRTGSEATMRRWQDLHS